MNNLKLFPKVIFVLLSVYLGYVALPYQALAKTVTYTITASAGSHGSISNSGKTTVNAGTSKTYTIKPDNSNYQIASVVVDGASKGALSSYTFSSVSDNHTISVTFVELTYKITTLGSVNFFGEVIFPASSITATYGKPYSVTIYGDGFLLLKGININGGKLITLNTINPYTYVFPAIPTVDGNQTIKAVWAMAPQGDPSIVHINGAAQLTPPAAVNNLGNMTAAAAVVASPALVASPAAATASSAVTVKTTETAIDNYFKALANGNNATSAKNTMNVDMQALNLADKNQASVYYNVNSVAIAETAINNFITKLSKGNADNNLANIVTATTQVVDAGDQNTVSVYYNSQLVTADETAIYNYFTALANGLSTTSDTAAMAALGLVASANQADRNAVLTYYNSKSVTTAETAIANYLAALAANSNSTKTQTIVNNALQAVVDDGAKASLMNSELNNYYIPSGITGTSNTDDNSFASTIALNSGKLFISMPALLNNGNSAIYEYSLSANKQWMKLPNSIVPNVENPNYRFGRVFAVKGNLLAASYEPVLTDSADHYMVLIFNLVNQKWQQVAEEDLGPSVGVPNNMVLSVAPDTVAVGLQVFPTLYIFSDLQSTIANQEGSGWHQVIKELSTSPLISIAANGDYVAAGYPAHHLVHVLKAVHPQSGIANWSDDTDIHNPNNTLGFGQSVSVYDPPSTKTVNFAIGSPVDGVVYLANKTINNQSTQAGNYSAPTSPIALFMPSFASAAGYNVLLQGNTLVVGTTPSNTNDPTHPGTVEVYGLNTSTNLWSWEYSYYNTSFAINSATLGASLAFDQGTLAIGSPKTSNNTASVGSSFVTIISNK